MQGPLGALGAGAAANGGSGGGASGPSFCLTCILPQSPCVYLILLYLSSMLYVLSPYHLCVKFVNVFKFIPLSTDKILLFDTWSTKDYHKK